MITYRYILLCYFYWSLYNYAAHAANILTPTTVVQGVDNHCRCFNCCRCYCIRRLLGTLQCCSRIFHFSHWLGQLGTVQTKDESLHTGYTLNPLGGVFYSLWGGGGARFYVIGGDLDFTSHPNDNGEPWERSSESRPNSRLAGVVFRNRVLNSGHPSKY